MLVGPMAADRLSVLLAEAPGLERASRLAPPRLPVLPALEGVLPDGGLRPGTTTSITGIGATSLALALVAETSKESWVAAVGLPSLGLRAAAELGVELDHLVVVPDPGKKWADILAALVDAFDIVLAHPAPTRTAQRLNARVRERDAVLVAVGPWPESDVRIEGTSQTWHGIDQGHGHLAARSIDVNVTGRRAASRQRKASLWLPDHDGEVTIARNNVVRFAR